MTDYLYSKYINGRRRGLVGNHAHLSYDGVMPLCKGQPAPGAEFVVDEKRPSSVCGVCYQVATQGDWSAVKPEFSDTVIDELLIRLDDTVDSLEDGVKCDDEARNIVREWLKNIDHGLKLWKEWFVWSGDPWVEDDYGGTTCFFCSEDHPNHAEMCFFVKAKELVSNNET